MIIVKISYTCPNTGQGAEAVVEPGEAPEDALGKLRDWVRSQSTLTSELEDLNRHKYQMTWDLENLVNCIYRARKIWEETSSKWQEAKKFAETHGIEIKEEFPSQPPLFFNYDQALDQIKTELDNSAS